MSMQELCDKLHLIKLKNDLNVKLKEQSDDHMFIDDAGFKRIVLMWIISKPAYTIDLAYEFFNNVLTFKVQIKFKEFNYLVANNFHFTLQDAKDFGMVTKFSASTIDSCLNKATHELRKAINNLTAFQRRIKKNG